MHNAQLPLNKFLGAQRNVGLYVKKPLCGGFYTNASARFATFEE